MEEVIKDAIADEPELLQYYQNNANEVNALVNKFATPREEIKSMVIILKAIDEEEIY